MLSTQQQATAVLAWLKQELLFSPSHAHLLSDTAFMDRLANNNITLFALWSELYGHRSDALSSLLELVKLMGASWSDRSEELRRLDKRRELEPEWFMGNEMVGGVCYVDRYAGDLEGVRKKIPYFKELGLTYVHLMPLFDSPEPKNDGGYAVSSYRKVKPHLGTMSQLQSLASSFAAAGISLVLDFIFNHTSSSHSWAQQALAGSKEHEGYYWVFPDRVMPDQYDRDTREVFPDDHSGSFVPFRRPEGVDPGTGEWLQEGEWDGRWVWSTFYKYQWDLRYENPKVFTAMAGEMLFLANMGVNILRMDAVAFIWKRLGTPCESLPEAHKILRCFNAVCRIAAPSLLFKSEAIVHPDFIVQYIDRYECQLSYNPLQMCLLWEAMATRETTMLSQALERRHNLAPGCAWVNYVRSHDDIGWTFADEDAIQMGKYGGEHRKFLNSFYVNRHPGSFARGVPFQDNPKTGDCRISGATASLAGLESGEPGAQERILLAHSVILSTGGIPLLYLGDEVGQLNDYSYLSNPATSNDSRWVGRPSYPAQRYEERTDEGSSAGAIFAGISRMIKLRKETPELAGARLVGFHTHNPAVVGYLRPGNGSMVLCLANFSDGPSWVGAETLGALPDQTEDLISGHKIPTRQGIHLRSHQYVWLRY